LKKNESEVDKVSEKKITYQCKWCFTIYDELYGDQINQISPGQPFEMIVVYECPTCGAPKKDFKAFQVACDNAAQ
jgi:rubredoxin